MKRIKVLMCAAVLGMCLTGCGNSGDENAAQQTTETQETIESNTTEGITGTDMQAGTEGNAVTEDTTAQDTNAEGTVAWSTEMEGIKQAVAGALGENYWPNTQIPMEMLEGNYGITSDMYDDYMGEIPMISTNVDTLIVIKAKEDKVSEVQAALNSYRDMMVADTMQYPANLGKIQASTVETIGNYVCFIQLGADTMAALEEGDEAVIKQCQEQNQLALEAIRGVIGQ